MYFWTIIYVLINFKNCIKFDNFNRQSLNNYSFCFKIILIFSRSLRYIKKYFHNLYLNLFFNKNLKFKYLLRNKIKKKTIYKHITFISEKQLK